MRTASRLWRIGGQPIIVVCGIMVASCSSLTEPLGYDLPDPDFSLDPAALVAPQLLWGCGEWLNGPRPSDEMMFVDVAFDRRTEEDADDRPTARHLSALKKYGGTVVYKFHFNAVRARIATDNVPKLAADEAVISVFRVANLSRYDWNASVGYRLPYSYVDGAAKFEDLGGRVEYRFNVINAIGGLIPDRSAAVLRDDRNVDHVESQAPFPNCF